MSHKPKEIVDVQPYKADSAFFVNPNRLTTSIEEGANDLLTEGLKDFQDLDQDNDFLESLAQQSELENEEVGILETDYEVYNYMPPVDLKNELMDFGINYTIRDLFIQRPTDRQYKGGLHNYNRQTYFINRIKHQPDLPILYTMLKHVDVYSHKTVPIFDYVETFSMLMDKYMRKGSLVDDEMQNIIYSSMYFLLCNVYIINNSQSDFNYRVENDEITFTLKREIHNPTTNQIDKISKLPNLLEEPCIEIDRVTFRQVMDIITFMEKYMQNNVTNFVDILTRSSKTYFMNKIKVQQDYEDLQLSD